MDDQTTKRTRKHNVWFDGRNVMVENYAVWELVAHSAIDTVVLTPNQTQLLHLPMRTNIVLAVDNEDEIIQALPTQVIFATDERLLDKAAALGHPTCLSLSIDNRELLERAWKLAAKYDYAVVDFDLPTNIPLELIIARLQGSDTSLLKRETTCEAAKTAFGVMEQGSDGVLFASDDLAEINRMSDYMLQAARRHLDLQPLVVAELRHIGMGVRGCVDTVDMLTQEEGMLVGSTSSGGVFICSETHYLPYMNLRPFRVNAGAVHSYLWTADDRAEYITDLGVGSKVLCVNTSGESREVIVGRMKIEVRPLLMIRGMADGSEINVIVQDDWHIRIMGADGKPRNATAIRPGDELLAYVDQPGRHVGIKVQETIIER